MALSLTAASEIAEFAESEPLALDSGGSLAPFTIAYKTYGTLNAAKSNAVLICHALTLDQYVASPNPTSGKPGWWEHIVGPGKPIDTDRYFVICPNILGGCLGSSGPASLNPLTSKP
jgi:homoserine O-acetyltransferase